jgi:hypothetical protein
MKGACCLVPIEQDNKAVCVDTSTNDGSGPVGKSRRARGAERAYSNTIANRKIGHHYCNPIFELQKIALNRSIN